MDPVSQVLAQQQSGSAGGEGFGQFFVQGAQLANQQAQLGLAARRLELEQRQETRAQKQQDLMLPLLAEKTRLENANAGIEVNANIMKLEAMTEMNAVLPDLYQLQVGFMRSPDGFEDQQLVSQTLQLAVKHPRAFAPGTPGSELLTSIKAVPMFRQQFAQVRQANEQLKGTGLSIQQINPKTGNIELMREQPNVPADIQAAMQLTAAQARVENITDPAKLNEIFFNNLRDIKIPYGMSVTTADGTTITTGRQPQGIVSDAEKVAVNAVNAVNYAKDVIKFAENGNVGLLGNINRLASEVGGQVIDIKPGDEFKYAQATDFLKATATKLLRSDGSISEAERKQIIEHLPGAGVKETPETAKLKAQNLMRIIGESARRQIERAGRPVPLELMTKDELFKLVQTKKITKEQAADALIKSPFNQ